MHRAEGETEEQILAALCLPRVTTLASSCCLIVGADEHDVVWVSELSGIGVGGVSLGKVYAVYALDAHSVILFVVVVWRKNNAFFVLYFTYTS